jgi:molybdopterin converting factor small subunit
MIWELIRAMEVNIGGSLRKGTGGASTIDIEASTIRELLTRLVERYPAMQIHLDEGVAVAINGDIYRDDWTRAIPDGAEVFLIPRIKGG